MRKFHNNMHKVEHKRCTRNLKSNLKPPRRILFIAISFVNAIVLCMHLTRPRKKTQQTERDLFVYIFKPRFFEQREKWLRSQVRTFFSDSWIVVRSYTTKRLFLGILTFTALKQRNLHEIVNLKFKSNFKLVWLKFLY